MTTEQLTRAAEVLKAAAVALEAYSGGDSFTTLQDECERAARRIEAGRATDNRHFSDICETLIGIAELNDAGRRPRLAAVSEAAAQPFVAVFGEVIGVQVAQAAAAALRGAREAAAGLASAGDEFVTEESRDVVGRAELAAFHDDVDALRDDIERIAARVARLPRAEHAA
jgi:hypothetical protein